MEILTAAQTIHLITDRTQAISSVHANDLVKCKWQMVVMPLERPSQNWQNSANVTSQKLQITCHQSLTMVTKHQLSTGTY